MHSAIQVSDIQIMKKTKGKHEDQKSSIESIMFLRFKKSRHPNQWGKKMEKGGEKGKKEGGKPSIESIMCLRFKFGTSNPKVEKKEKEREKPSIESIMCLRSAILVSDARRR